MKASEVMLESAVMLTPEMSIPEAAAHAAKSTLDILPVVDANGAYQGSVSKASLLGRFDHHGHPVAEACSADALVCGPNDPLEHLEHDAEASVPHQTVMVVDDNQRFHGVVPYVHWAVDEAKTQSGYPRERLEARTVAMHLVYRCTDCGELMRRNDGIPPKCPNCGAGPEVITLHTED